MESHRTSEACQSLISRHHWFTIKLVQVLDVEQVSMHVYAKNALRLNTILMFTGRHTSNLAT